MKGNTAFALDLFQQLRSEGGNLFFSPYSISTALAMTYAGARGETEKQMAKAMHFGLPQEKLHPVFAELQAGLSEAQRTNGVQLFVANSLWPAKGLSLKQNEEGTEAAAATGVIMRTSATRPPILFRADHPFLFFIRHKSSGSVLFMGSLREPTK